MSVLETFLILFETNKKEVVKDYDAVEQKGKDLQGNLLKTAQTTEALSGAFMQMASHAVGAISAVIGVGALIHRFFATSEFTAMLNDANETLDVGVDMLAMYGAAAKENGGSTEGFIASLRSLNSAMAQIDVTGKSRLLPFFKELGINALDAHGKVRPVLELLPEIADSFQHMSKGQSSAIGQRLGLDPGTILLLQKGRLALEETLRSYKELGVITKQDAEISDKFHDTLDRLGYVLTVVFAKIGSFVLPGLTGLTEMLIKLFGVMQRNGRIFGVALIVISGILLNVFAPACAAAAAALFPLIEPFLFIATVIGMAVLALEDFLAYLNDAPSITGIVVDKLKAQFRDLGDYLAKIWAEIKDGFLAIWNLPGNIIKLGKNALSGPQVVPTYFSPETRAAYFAAQGGGSKSVNIGEIKVQTQATDADGISKAIGSSLNTQMNQTLNNMDDGVKG
jgi:hypothetical protein